MSEPVIKIQNLSKRYRIGVKEERYRTIRESIMSGIKAPFKNIKTLRKLTNFDNSSNSSKEKDVIWALKNVSFDVEEGEVIGIIGRNGAGKSTLLKILSRITEPTEGEVRIRGRVGSLLEVGTGFHPELTGRENVFLNGAILGMRKEEIKMKFDEIVAFAEIEKFLDTPVKRYSSGMYVRLAFAVAAHLEPEILLVDEVLAVGDIAFQRKCLGKMEDIGKQGHTVLFISHNIQAINQLCSRSIIVNGGTIIANGDTQSILNLYVTMAVPASTDGDLTSVKLRSSQLLSKSLFKWTYGAIINNEGKTTLNIRYGEPFTIILRGYATETCKKIRVGFGIINKISGVVFNSHQHYNGLPNTLPKGTSEFRIKIDPNILAPGFYAINIGAVGYKVEDRILECLEFKILELGFTTDKVWDNSYKRGVIDYPWCNWSLGYHATKRN